MQFAGSNPAPTTSFKARKFNDLRAFLFWAGLGSCREMSRLLSRVKLYLRPAQPSIYRLTIAAFLLADATSPRSKSSFALWISGSN